jgi:hypothetical protein
MMSFFMMDSGTNQVGVEVHRGDIGGQRRRGAVGLAHHDDVAAHDLLALDRLGGGSRKVHHDVALAEMDVHGGETVERAAAGAAADRRAR